MAGFKEGERDCFAISIFIFSRGAGGAPATTGRRQPDEWHPRLRSWLSRISSFPWSARARSELVRRETLER